MRTPFALWLVLVAIAFGWGQSRSDAKAPAPQIETSSCSMDRTEVQDEIKELSVHVSRMESRIVMIRNSAGTVQDPQVRNALQVDADLWQDEVDYLRRYSDRLRSVADRCEAREKINQGTK